MGRFFNIDSGFSRFMSRVADLVILNLIFLLCCIPIITIGPALTALHYVTMKMARNEEAYIIRSFFQAFRKNFRQGVIIHIIMLIAGWILYLDFSVSRSMNEPMSKIMLYLCSLLLFVYLMVFLYIYPLLAKFYNTIANTFRNAILMAIRHLPYTILMLVISVLPAGILLIPNFQLQASLILLCIMTGCSLISFINGRFFAKVFDHYIPEEDDAAENTATAGAELPANEGADRQPEHEDAP